MALLITYSFSSFANAAFIIGNFKTGTNNDGMVYTFDSTVQYAIGITVGADPLILSDLTLRLAAASSPVIASIDLRTNPDTAGTVLGSVNVTGSNVQNYLFNLAPVQLNAGSTYWLNITTNLTGNGNGLLLAANSDADTPSGPGLANFAGLSSGLVGGQSNLLPNLAPVPTLSINGITAVPEPTSLGLIGLLAATGCRRAMRSMKRRSQS